jgi:hypothetical protein
MASRNGAFCGSSHVVLQESVAALLVKLLESLLDRWRGDVGQTHVPRLDRGRHQEGIRPAGGGHGQQRVASTQVAGLAGALRPVHGSAANAWRNSSLRAIIGHFYPLSAAQTSDLPGYVYWADATWTRLAERPRYRIFGTNTGCPV